jgi:autotransporter-associated beta strand protein
MKKSIYTRMAIYMLALGGAALFVHQSLASVVFLDTFDSGTGNWYKGGTEGTLSTVAEELSWEPGSTDDARNNIGRSFSSTSVAVGETIRLTFDYRKVSATADILRAGIFNTTTPITVDNWASGNLIGAYSGYYTFIRDNSASTHIPRYQAYGSSSNINGPLNTSGVTAIGSATTQYNINDNGTVTYQGVFEITRVSASQIETLFTLSSGGTTHISVPGTNTTTEHMMSEFNTVALRTRYASVLFDNIKLEVIKADGTWITDGNGNWTDPVNWQDGVIANLTDNTAYFTNAFSADSTVTLNGNRTIGNITYSNISNKYLRISGDTLTLSTASGMPTIDAVVSGYGRRLIIASAISASGGFIKTGAGTLNLTASNPSLTGDVRLDQGQLFLTATAPIDSVLSVILNGGTLRHSAGSNQSTDRAFEITEGGGILSKGSTGTLNLTGLFSASGSGDRTLTLFSDNTGEATLTSAVGDPSSGALSLDKAGGSTPGTWTIAGANTFSGSTTISAGILNLGHINALQNSYINTTASVSGDASNGLKTSQTTLNLGGLSGNKGLWTVFSDTGGDRGGYNNVGAITLNVAAGNDLTHSAAITGGRALTKTGPGSQTLTGANTFGATTLNGGTLGFGAANNSFGTLTVSNDTTIALGAGQLTFADSSALAANWTGLLTITGTLGAETVRFGTADTALAAGQLEKILINGSNATLSATGFLEALPPPPPTVTIGAGATDVVGTRSAYLRGEITAGVTADAYICWGTVSNTTSTSAWQNVISVGTVTQDVPFTNTVTDLLYGQQYYYRVYATNTSGPGWSAVEEFTKIVPSISATGGDITIDGDGYYIHVFTNNGTFSFESGSGEDTVEVLVVGGGGGSGASGGGGGGAGGVSYTSAYTVVSGDITVTVGGGGAARTPGEASAFGTLSALGGGRGASQSETGDDRAASIGGSGGGGTRFNTSGAAGTAGQGSAGGNGNGVMASSQAVGGGGGGASEPGGAGTTATEIPGHGGDGRYFEQFASKGYPSGWFGGGGGGGNTYIGSTNKGIGGNGGGGNGGVKETSEFAQNGRANTGGGGGGGTGLGRTGGSGIVIVRYLPELTTTIATTTATNVTPFTATLRGTLDAENTVFAVTAYVSTSNNLTSAAWEADGTKLPVAAGSYTNASEQAISGSATALSESTHYYYTFKAVTPSGNATIWASSNGEFTTRAYSTTFRFR